MKELVLVGTLRKESNNKLTELSDEIKRFYKESESLPMIAYYPVGRVVEKSVVPFFRQTGDVENLDVYANALEGKPNFHNFFKWFKEQEDFVNQRGMSRTLWIKRHAPQLRRKFEQLFFKIEKLAQSKEIERLLKRGRLFKDFEFFMDEPRFLFREIIDAIEFSDLKGFGSSNIYEVFDELDYMLHKMGSLYREKDFLTPHSRDRLLEILKRTIDIVSRNRVEIEAGDHMFDLIWSMFSLSFELGLWWLSDEGHSNLSRELDSVAWPTRQQSLFGDDIDKFKDKILGTVYRIIENDMRKHKTAKINFGRDLEFVSYAIEKFIPEYKNIRIDRNERGSAQMLVDKDGKEFDIGQLSDGEKNLIALIGDIARRLTIANPQSDKPLEESGIVLIDELDLHLHPKWQRIVAERITKVFPKCQFIVSSHSPQVISHIKAESIIALKNEGGEINVNTVNDSYGKNSDRILEDIMDETARPKKVKKELHQIFKLIEDGEIDNAREEILRLREKIGEDGELIKAEVLIKRKEIIGK